MTKSGHGDDGHHAAQGIAGEADDPAADIAAQGEDGLAEGLEALVDPAASDLRDIQRVPVPDARRVGLGLVPQLRQAPQDLGGLLDHRLRQPAQQERHHQQRTERDDHGGDRAAHRLPEPAMGERALDAAHRRQQHVGDDEPEEEGRQRLAPPVEEPDDAENEEEPEHDLRGAARARHRLPGRGHNRLRRGQRRPPCGEFAVALAHAVLYPTLHGRTDRAPGPAGSMVTDRSAARSGDAAGGAALATGRGSAEENVRIPEVQAGGRGGARSDRGTPSFIFCNAAAVETVPHDMLLS